LILYPNGNKTRTALFGSDEKDPFLGGPALAKHWFLKGKALSLLPSILRSRQLVLCKESAPPERDREEGKIWPSYVHTMIGLERLNNVRQCIEAKRR